MKELLQPLTTLLMIVPIIIAAVYLLKKFVHKAQMQGNPIKIINQIAIGTKERVLHIEVNGTKLLLGATPNQITTLHVFDKPSEKPDAVAPTPLKPKLGNVVHD